MTTTQQLAIFATVLVVGAGVYFLWPASQQERARQQLEKARAAARAALASAPGTTFNEDALAAIDGSDMLDNPHCTPGGHQGQSVEWHCGWVHGTKLLRQMGGQP